MGEILHRALNGDENQAELHRKAIARLKETQCIRIQTTSIVKITIMQSTYPVGHLDAGAEIWTHQTRQLFSDIVTGNCASSAFLDVIRGHLSSCSLSIILH